MWAQKSPRARTEQAVLDENDGDLLSLSSALASLPPPPSKSPTASSKQRNLHMHMPGLIGGITASPTPKEAANTGVPLRSGRSSDTPMLTPSHDVRRKDRISPSPTPHELQLSPASCRPYRRCLSRKVPPHPLRHADLTWVHMTTRPT
eukprot:CAMPEP_0177682718 /NCGR_PEP_ID=MMETSP0447-20121125/31403_1 /TAXON_ID=0 /ORGANISM="Stygamoeba regulata, Strain BSH-02190019" /LENGTH=147 /DNA_ID=CAMNT_0019192229 /DNA_START=172 /DNA_END=615 /DNA_ORIENTATION=+